MKSLFFLFLASLLFRPFTLAEDLQDFIALQENTRALASQSIPKTVLVRGFTETGRQSLGTGSGGIISPEGHILTCAHVLTGIQRIEIVLHDGTILEAQRLGYNERNDYCLLKVEGKNLPYFELGDSDELRQGEWVMALGHPGGANVDRKASCSIGQITLLHTKLPAQYRQRYYGNAIKSDTPIFSGNSGGPLINLKGELIGINAAIILHTEDSYSLPLNEVKEVLPFLKEGTVLEGYQQGQYPSAHPDKRKSTPPPRSSSRRSPPPVPEEPRAFLGVYVSALDEQMQEVLELPEGIYITEVTAGSPAAQAKLQKYDIILKIEEELIFSPEQFVAKIQSYKPQTQVEMLILRNGQEKKVAVTFGSR